MPNEPDSSSGNHQAGTRGGLQQNGQTNGPPARPDPPQVPLLLNFALPTTSDSFPTPLINQAMLQRNGSPNFSFDSDSPGLAIAEDDDVIEETPAPVLQQQQPTESAQLGGSEFAPTVGSVDSAASAERDGFEVVRIREEAALGEAGRQAAEKSGPTEDGKAKTGMDRPPSLDPSPIILDNDDDPIIIEPPTKAETSAKALTGKFNVKAPKATAAVFGVSNPIFSSQHQPNAEVMQILNEHSVRQLREKLELEQKRQLAAEENSKQVANALFSLNAGAAANMANTATHSALKASSAIPSAIIQPFSHLTSDPAQAAASANLTNSLTNSTRPGETGQNPKRREAYRWASNLPIFSMAWSYKRYPNQRLRLACSSVRDGHELLKNTMSIVEFDEEHGELSERTQVFIGAPSCELRFIPTTDSSQPDLIASATRELRIYSYHTEQQEVILEAKLCPNKSYAYAGPLTSVDWNEADPRIIGGSSIDSTCTIWDVEAQESIAVVPPPAFQIEQQRLKYKIQTQLIAHERPVHGMAFSRLGSGRDYFASCSADGSVRLFDLRNLKNSTILYEHPDRTKLNHISWNKMEPAQFVIVADSSNELVICDVRMPCRPLVKYNKHLKPVNSVDWAPHSPTHFCSGSSDHQALIWQLHGISDEPLLAYRSEGEITRIRWSSTYNNWIGISFANCLEILRV